MTGTDASRATSAQIPCTEAEFHAFTGPTDTLARRLFALPRDTVERTLWALLLQGPGSARIQLQERAVPGDPMARVYSWAGDTLDPLPDRLVALLPTATYRDLRTVLLDHGEYSDLGTVPCPPTPRGAFGHPLKVYGAGAGVRAYVLAL
ncbi:hypothetical protein ACFP1Z_03190 [Streptomyces gamaensis]|uniref:Uncharacterized protein n=1 Tax=Streptomyces gamaensis TaxID=1763542 RepID=A0ABW0YYN4_9ACTN